MNGNQNGTESKPGTDPNKGMDTRVFMGSVLVALLVILFLAFLFLLRESHAIKPPTPPHPTSKLESPFTPIQKNARNLS